MSKVQHNDIGIEHVAYWLENGHSRYGYTAFGTLVCIRANRSTTRPVLPCHTVEVKFPKSVTHTFIYGFGRQEVKSVAAIDRGGLSTSYNLVLSCGHQLLDRRIYLRRQEIRPAKGLLLTCPQC